MGSPQINLNFGEAAIVWDPTTECYRLNFKPWGKRYAKQKDFITLLKQLPASDRHYERVVVDRNDPYSDIHNWYIVEKHYDGVKLLLELCNFYIKIDITKERVDAFNQGQHRTSVVNTSEYLGKISGIAQRLGIEFVLDSLQVASKGYRKIAMQLHPDRNSSPEAARDMSIVNEAWSAIKKEKGW